MTELRTVLVVVLKTPDNHFFFSCYSFLVSILADDFSSQENLESPEAGGWDASLGGEDDDDFFELQIVKHYDGEVRDAHLRL